MINTLQNVFRESGLPCDNRGFMIVDDYLRCVKYKNIFGAGDCISMEKFLDSKFPPKAGVFAVREGPYLAQNILSLIDSQTKLKAYKPQTNFLSILITSSKKAIAIKYGFYIHSALMMKFKYKLDTDFMKKFQRTTLERDDLEIDILSLYNFYCRS